MTDLATARSRHVPDYPPAYKAHEGPCCKTERVKWPCDAAAAFALADELGEALGPIAEALHDRLTHHEKPWSECDWPACRPSRTALVNWEASHVE